MTRYVALGDSYTIGTGVATGERWPNQLCERLRRRGLDVVLAANLGVNGYTSADLIADELPALSGLRPDLVTVLIGVNDVVRAIPPERYRANVAQALDTILASLPASRIVTVSTPDFTVTPAGAEYGDPALRSTEIRRFNGLLATMSRHRGIAHVDIHDLSLRAATDRTLVAGDGLHPSGAQYALWVDRIAPVVAGMLALPASGPNPRRVRAPGDPGCRGP